MTTRWPHHQFGHYVYFPPLRWETVPPMRSEIDIPIARAFQILKIYFRFQIKDAQTSRIRSDFLAARNLKCNILPDQPESSIACYLGDKMNFVPSPSKHTHTHYRTHEWSTTTVSISFLTGNASSQVQLCFSPRNIQQFQTSTHIQNRLLISGCLFKRNIYNVAEAAPAPHPRPPHAIATVVVVCCAAVTIIAASSSTQEIHFEYAKHW